MIMAYPMVEILVCMSYIITVAVCSTLVILFMSSMDCLIELTPGAPPRRLVVQVLERGDDQLSRPPHRSIQSTPRLSTPSLKPLHLALSFGRHGGSSNWYVLDLCANGALLTLHQVLDGGTGFLKVGYAGQVSSSFKLKMVRTLQVLTIFQ